METNTHYVNEILLRRKNKVFISVLSTENEQHERERLVKLAVMMKNIQGLGYTFSKDLINNLKTYDTVTLDNIYLDLMNHLKSYIGADKDYKVMYPNFPKQVIEADLVELFVNAILAYISDCEIMPDYSKDERLPLLDETKFTILTVGSDTDLKQMCCNLVESKTSLSEQDKKDFYDLLDYIDSDILYELNITYKENLPIVTNVLLDKFDTELWFDKVSWLYKTATDVLRLAVVWSDGDVSLANLSSMHFKSLPRAKRRLLIQLLDNCGEFIAEDMRKYKKAWVLLGESLHVGEYPQYQNVKKAFYALRNNVYIPNFFGKVEKAMFCRDWSKVVALLKQRPGEFARMLDAVLRKAYTSANKDAAAMSTAMISRSFLEMLEEKPNSVSISVLLQVKEHFAHRNDENEMRVFFPKGSTAKVWSEQNNLPSLPETLCIEITNACTEAIIEQCSTKASMGKVFIDDNMKKYAIPQSQRSASKITTNVITRGSILPLNEKAKAVRGFIWWTNAKNGERVDIDLSAAIFDENFKYKEHVSYTNLRSANYKACHSGDITNAPRPDGVSEFLDVDIDSVVNYGGRYIVYQVYNYTQQNFSTLDSAMFGFMEREDVNTGEIYEPKTVQMKMDLTSQSTVCIPVIFDCVKKEFIWIDAAITSNSFDNLEYYGRNNNLENHLSSIEAICYGFINNHKPVMYDLALMNVLGRGEIVRNREDADIIISNDTTKPVMKIVVRTVDEKGNVLEENEKEIEKDVQFITSNDIDVWMSDML